MQRVPTKSPQSLPHSVIETFLRAVTDRANRYLPKQRDEVKMQDKGFSQRSVHKVKDSPAAVRKLLKGRGLLKGGGRNRTDVKGFADLSRHVSLSVTECHGRVNTGFF